MSWLYSRALVEEYWEARCLDGEQCALWKEIHTPLAYLQQDRMTEFSRLSRYGVTFARLTESLGEELLTWFLEDFHAKTLAQQGRALESTEKDLGYGLKWQESSERYDLDSHLWKTHLCLFQEDLPWSSVILPKWGMSANGYVWQHPKLERPIRGIVSGLLPTPSGVNGGRNNVMGRIDEWGGSGNPFRGTEIGKVRCASFEEWMMGWPTGWSALTPLETGKFQEWQQQHSMS